LTDSKNTKALGHDVYAPKKPSPRPQRQTSNFTTHDHKDRKISKPTALVRGCGRSRKTDKPDPADRGKMRSLDTVWKTGKLK